VALIVDAVSYVVSGLCVLGIRTRDSMTAKVRTAGGFWADTKVGFSLLRQDAVLRTVSLSSAVMNFFAQIQMVVYFLFMVEDLHFGPGLIGLLFGLSGAVGFVTAIMCDRLIRRQGLGTVLVIGQLVQAAAGACLAFAGGSRVSSIVLVLLGESLFAIGLSLFGVSYLTVRQLRTADDVRGRVIAASRFLTLSLLPAASLVGGTLASLVGLRQTLVIGAIGMAAACLLVVRRRVLDVH
jgi:predicted MFS family arabinose efflux permease